MALTPTATRELLARLRHAPKRFLGQNFLVDGNIVRKSLELGQISAGDTVVEVGPGLGTLTGALLEAGADVWAVERDRTLCAHLASDLAHRFPETLHLCEGDAVGLPLAGLPADRAPGCKVVANLPYAISSPWMDAVLSGPLPSRMVLMVQREAADRYTAGPGTRNFGAISIFLQAAYDTAPGHRVSSSCFYPRPDVGSTLLHLVRKASPHLFAPEQRTLVRRCFQQRRKQLGAVIRSCLPGREKDWRELLKSAGFSSTVRAEAIPVPVWTRLLSGSPGPA
ncbi:MAG TPA: 16S rRNA (adenine(1518)-N(6)/adenine(1519)-N(6))-dimethyltransferase RsmA [Opitutaceae bacterium]|nr:16S rRNA (adenine(1518)-N(6)/adenine(1519)-N(6))-dimethyltransferase RsmA [Opitutaceae bacterium]